MIYSDIIWYIVILVLGIIFILRVYYLQKLPTTVYINGIAITALRDEELIEYYTAQTPNSVLKKVIEREMERRKLNINKSSN